MVDMRDVDTSDAAGLSEGFKAVPPGFYPLYMESSEKKDTKDGKGAYLACIFKVATLDEYEGASIFCNFNFWNENQKAVEIAKSSWRAICEAALGQPTAINNESASLHNKLFVAEISNVPAYNKDTKKNDHPTMRSNEIIFRKGTIVNSKEYFEQQKAKPTPAAQPAAQGSEAPTGTTAPAVTPGKGARPWDKK